MENFMLQGESKSAFMPDVILEASTGKCLIEGDSYMENPFGLYQSIQKWITSYLQEKGGKVELSIKLSYINSTSSRAVLELLRGIYEQQQQGKNIVVRWMHPKPSEDLYDIKEDGEDFLEESGVAMEFVEY